MSDLLADPATYGSAVPHAEFARLRQHAPVSWVDEPLLSQHSEATGAGTRRGPGFWAVTRYAAVRVASQAIEVFSSAAGGAFLADPRTPADLERARQLLVSMDAPRHAVMRRLVTPAFSPGALAGLRGTVSSHARAVVDRVLGMGEFDVVGDLAAELPLLVLADLLGMPREDRALLLRWSNTLVGFDDPEYGGGNIDEYQRTFVEAFQYVAELAATRRRHPSQDDLVGRLVGSEVDGRRLTEQELGEFWLLLVVAGNETTRHLVSGGLLALTEWRQETRRLAADPSMIPVAVEELLRWVTPIMQFRRTAVRDTELHGQPISAGDKVVLYYIAANRDDTVFTEPDRLDLGRTPNPHLAFGIGPHTCLGARLAKMEARVLFDLLRPHLERLELTGPPVRLRSNFMNGIKSLPARWHS